MEYIFKIDTQTHPQQPHEGVCMAYVMAFKDMIINTSLNIYMEYIFKIDTQTHPQQPHGGVCMAYVMAFKDMVINIHWRSPRTNSNIAVSTNTLSIPWPVYHQGLL